MKVRVGAKAVEDICWEGRREKRDGFELRAKGWAEFGSRRL